MTIIAFHHTEDALLAVADGLISRAGARVIDETKKILAFKPAYKVPRVLLERFNGFSEYNGGVFCIGYAGNFTIISDVINTFTSIVTSKLVLDRDSAGTPTVYNRLDEGRGLRERSYSDDYNFSSDDMPPITINFLANILQKVIESTCADFAKNAMQSPDIEIILFGEETVSYRGRIRAQVIKCKDFTFPNAVIERYSVLPWRTVCIGDASVIPSLINSIEADPMFNAIPPDEQVRTSIIIDHVVKLIRLNIGTIGGDCTIARATWANALEITTV